MKKPSKKFEDNPKTSRKLVINQRQTVIKLKMSFFGVN